MSVNLYKLENELEAIKFLLINSNKDYKKLFKILSDKKEVYETILIYTLDSEVFSINPQDNIKCDESEGLLFIESDMLDYIIYMDNITFVKVIKK